MTDVRTESFRKNYLKSKIAAQEHSAENFRNSSKVFFLINDYDTSSINYKDKIYYKRFAFKYKYCSTINKNQREDISLCVFNNLLSSFKFQVRIQFFAPRQFKTVRASIIS